MEHIANSSSIPWVEKYRPSKFEDIVLDPLNRQLFENCLNSNYFPNLLFYGPPGGGKCHSINTPILMFDGSIKMVQDIAVGDIVMGDDSTARHVLSLGQGQDQMYDVVLGDGDSYGVNSDHILCLYDKASEEIVEITVKEYLALSKDSQNQLLSIRTGVDFSGRVNPEYISNPYKFGYNLDPNNSLEYIPDDYKLNTKHVRSRLIQGFMDKHAVVYYNKAIVSSRIPYCTLHQLPDRLATDVIFILRSLNYDLEIRPDEGGSIDIFLPQETCYIPFEIVPTRVDTYYGFTLDGNHRYVLGNFIVTHNTTTIINLINEYQSKYHKQNKSNVIHLNASDERGIDTIRNQIHQFVKSMNLFEAGLKFVILDEVDYMTKNAQQALKYILQTSNYNVRFCLICNYITKIDEALKNEFICIRFNQLPKEGIFQFIKSIAVNEKLTISDTTIETIQDMYNSDIRSMINYIQLNQNNFTSPIVDLSKRHTCKLTPKNSMDTIMNSGVLEQFDLYLKDDSYQHYKSAKEKQLFLIEYIHRLSVQYNMDKRTIIQKYFNHIIRNHPERIKSPNNKPSSQSSVLKTMEVILHRHDIPIDVILKNVCEL
jgi:DNA polymerase III delta prime subunit